MIPYGFSVYVYRRHTPLCPMRGRRVLDAKSPPPGGGGGLGGLSVRFACVAPEFAIEHFAQRLQAGVTDLAADLTV